MLHQGVLSLHSLTARMPGFAAEFRGLTYFTLCHSLADTMSLKWVPLPHCCPTINPRWVRNQGTQNAPPRRTATGRSLRNGAYEVLWVRDYRCGHQIRAPNQGAGFKTQGHRYRSTSFPAHTASGRNRNQNRRAEPRRPPHAGRRWPPPDRRAPRPHRRPSCRRRSRLRPPRPHAGWSLR